MFGDFKLFNFKLFNYLISNVTFNILFNKNKYFFLKNFKKYILLNIK